METTEAIESENTPHLLGLDWNEETYGATSRYRISTISIHNLLEMVKDEDAESEFLEHATNFILDTKNHEDHNLNDTPSYFLSLEAIAFNSNTPASSLLRITKVKKEAVNTLELRILVGIATHRNANEEILQLILNGEGDEDACNSQVKLAIASNKNSTGDILEKIYNSTMKEYRDNWSNWEWPIKNTMKEIIYNSNTPEDIREKAKYYMSDDEED